MNFLAALAARLIEKLIVFIAQVLTGVAQEKIDDEAAKRRAEKNLKAVQDAKTPEERRERVEDLLNDQ